MSLRPTGYGGQGFSLRGEKDRFVLPPSFRKDFADKGDERILCLAKHERWPCLKGFSLSLTDTFEDMLDREEEAALRRNQDFDRELRGMQLWGFTEVPFDASGRFIIPEHIAEIGDIGDALYFQGGTPFLTLWNPQRLNAMGSGWEQAQANCRALAAAAEAKAKGKSGGKGK